MKNKGPFGYNRLTACFRKDFMGKYKYVIQRNQFDDNAFIISIIYQLNVTRLAKLRFQIEDMKA